MILDLFERKNRVSEILGTIYLKNNEESIVLNQEKKNSKQKLYTINYIPEYLDYSLDNVEKYTIKKFSQVKGYSISMEAIKTIELYVKQQFKSNAKTIRRYINKLESCFNIRYKLFFGEIDVATYEYLMTQLWDMTTKRFGQKNDTSKHLREWDKIKSIMLPLIYKKEASIFVIYEGDKPIEISLNYHLHKILFSFMSSYDIAYSKFGLGHVEIYKQLEWCLQNNYRAFEMGWGDLDYKRRWSNNIYDFEQHLIYPKNAPLHTIYAIAESSKIKCKNYLISKNIHVKVKELKKRFVKTNKSKSENWVLKPQDSNLLYTPLNKINYMEEKFYFLRKFIYDFLYANNENIKNISVFSTETNNLYIITGKQKNILLQKE